jgi:hypothetical protein
MRQFSSFDVDTRDMLWAYERHTTALARDTSADPCDMQSVEYGSTLMYGEALSVSDTAVMKQHLAYYWHLAYILGDAHAFNWHLGSPTNGNRFRQT